MESRRNSLGQAEEIPDLITFNTLLIPGILLLLPCKAGLQNQILYLWRWGKAMGGRPPRSCRKKWAQIGPCRQQSPTCNPTVTGSSESTRLCTTLPPPNLGRLQETGWFSAATVQSDRPSHHGSRGRWLEDFLQPQIFWQVS